MLSYSLRFSLIEFLTPLSNVSKPSNLIFCIAKQLDTYAGQLFKNFLLFLIDDISKHVKIFDDKYKIYSNKIFFLFLYICLYKYCYILCNYDSNYNYFDVIFSQKYSSSKEHNILFLYIFLT